jgi:hypothetical protein
MSMELLALLSRESVFDPRAYRAQRRLTRRP